MTVHEKIIDLLDKNNVEYEVIEHEPVFTSADAAKIRDTNVSMGAKALVLMADKKPVLAVVPGNERLDFKKFKKEYGVKDLRMAKPEEVFEITTLEIGSIPPVGKAMDLKSYYDESFLEKDVVAFNAGSHTISIKMKAKDLISVELPVISSLV
jgi:Ala-tRNA(Pro) deacylase